MARTVIGFRMRCRISTNPAHASTGISSGSSKRVTEEALASEVWFIDGLGAAAAGVGAAAAGVRGLRGADFAGVQPLRGCTV